MRAAGYDASFRATGQTGILIAGEGVPIDAVVSDFVAGAVERLSPAAAPSHWDLIEGQGSLFHPSFAGLSLGLLHGSQPDALVVCHEPTRRTMRGVATPLPPIAEVIAWNVAHARLTNPDARAIGLAIDTSRLPETEARICLAELEDAHGLPATDPLRFGVSSLLARLANEFGAPR